MKATGKDTSRRLEKRPEKRLQKRSAKGLSLVGHGRSGIRLLFALLIFAVSVGASFALEAKPAYACSCAIVDTEEAAGYADTIFSGQAVERRETPPAADGTRSSADPVYYEFKVDAAWKGTAYETTTVSTQMSESSCGTEFKLGENYLVFAGKDGAMLSTGLCSGNQSYAAGVKPAAMQQLGEPVDVLPGASPGSPASAEAGDNGSSAVPAYVWWIAGALVLAIAVLAWARDRRKPRV